MCRRGRLFKAGSVTVVDVCDVCGTQLGAHDVGDGASVFLIFVLGFSIMPLAWMFERAFTPPLWVHVVVWGLVALGMIAVLLPASKAYLILLEFRHRAEGRGK